MAKAFPDEALPGLRLSFTQTKSNRWEEVTVVAEFTGYPYRIRCPKCYAAPGDRCLTGGGRRTPAKRPHGWRIAAQHKRARWVAFKS